MDERDIGNLFMIGFFGTRFDHEVRELVDELNPCGVILFSRNMESPLQTASLTRELQAHALSASNGLFVGVDQEGGRVRRLEAPFAVFPPALELASSDENGNAVREYARVTAKELRLAGFNLDFVPVLDVVDSSAQDKVSVIGDRSYGSDPEEVARLGLIVMETMRSYGVVTCGKHFPGHGGTLIDSHKELPVDNRTAESIRTRDLVPFARAVNRHVDMIMTAHVLYPSLDPANVATLSPDLIDGLLRGTLGFDGVVVTDDLDMSAVSQTYPCEESSLRALTAGVDIPLICNNPEKAFSARKRILQAFEQGELPEVRVSESLARIARLKARYETSMRPADIDRVREYFYA